MTFNCFEPQEYGLSLPKSLCNGANTVDNLGK